ncbi:MAG: nitroreductase family protein [Anaerohalosphaeraceae bacterium]
MSFLDLANNRYSVRNYKNTPVPEEKLNRCIEAVKLAPSACNSQPYKFIIVNDPDLKNKLAKEAFEGLVNFNHFAYQSPVLALIVSDRQKFSAKIGGFLKRKNFSLMDIGIAAEHFCLQATEEGLGTCMLGWFNEKRVKNILSIPKLKRVELMISVGFSADEKTPDKNRKTMDEILTYNQYP